MNFILRNTFRAAFVILFFGGTFSSCSFGTTGSVSGSSSSTTIRSGSSTSENRLRSDIVKYAKNQLGSDYKYAGRNPREGFDCSGFTHFVMKNFDFTLPTVSGLQEGEGQKIKLDEVKPGDLVFFRREPNGRVFHVAMVIANQRDGIQVIHSTTSRGVVIDNISTSSYWAPKLSSARDILTK